MTGPQAPAGWYPDPWDVGLIRYWDGAAWTDDTAVPGDLGTVSQTTRQEPQATPPATDQVSVPQSTSTWVKAVLGVLIAVLVAGAIALLTDVGSDQSSPFGEQPRQERAVVEVIQEARREYAAANHDLQRDAALADRDEQICALLGDGRVQNWTGEVYQIESDGDGRGILGVNIEPDTQVETRSSFADDENTLIEPGQLLDRITVLETGQVVTFSGRFIPDETEESCFTNPRFTQRNKIERPLMVFRFSDVRD